MVSLFYPPTGTYKTEEFRSLQNLDCLASEPLQRANFRLYFSVFDPSDC